MSSNDDQVAGRSDTGLVQEEIQGLNASHPPIVKVGSDRNRLLIRYQRPLPELAISASDHLR